MWPSWSLDPLPFGEKENRTWMDCFSWTCNLPMFDLPEAMPIFINHRIDPPKKVGKVWKPLYPVIPFYIIYLPWFPNDSCDVSVKSPLFCFAGRQDYYCYCQPGHLHGRAATNGEVDVIYLYKYTILYCIHNGYIYIYTSYNF